jgi:hypothetical protein
LGPTVPQIPALYGIDTRALTQRIRDKGAMLGKIVFPSDDEAKVPQIDPNQINLVAQARRAPGLPPPGRPRPPRPPVPRAPAARRGLPLH